LEFRDIVSKKLGLNISGFTLGEYEYIANIENVLNAPQHTGLFLQQANSMSVLGNSEEVALVPASARACQVCPSWSACDRCLSKCGCVCVCRTHNQKYFYCNGVDQENQ